MLIFGAKFFNLEIYYLFTSGFSLFFFLFFLVFGIYLCHLYISSLFSFSNYEHQIFINKSEKTHHIDFACLFVLLNQNFYLTLLEMIPHWKFQLETLKIGMVIPSQQDLLTILLSCSKSNQLVLRYIYFLWENRKFTGGEGNFFTVV